MRDIGKNIRDARDRKGLTQDELAAQLFVTRQTVSNYETGRTRPDIDTIVRLAELLGTDANTILYGPPVPESRRTEYRRFIISTVLLVAVAVAVPTAYTMADRLWGKVYFVEPVILILYWGFPLLLILCGWWIINVAATVGKMKPLQERWVPKARLAVWVLLILCGLTLLPESICYLIDCVHYFRYGNDNNIALGLPEWYKEFMLWLWTLIVLYDWVWCIFFVLVGAALRLFGFLDGNKKTTKETAHAVSFAIYGSNSSSLSKG